MNKPLPKPLNLPRPPRPVDPNRIGDGKNSYAAEVMQLFQNERIGEYTHRALFFLEQEGKPRRELARRLGSSPDDALDNLIVTVQGSTGLTAHARFVRPAVQAVRDEMARIRETRKKLYAALEETAALLEADAPQEIITP